MGAPAISINSSRLKLSLLGLLVGLAVALFGWGAPSAHAAPLVGKDGRIHACYKLKGKGKGNLRVVRGAKARCPRGWKKTSWSATGAPGAAGENGANGGDGQPGSAGGTGANGAAGTSARVTSLESQVTELLGKLKGLEGILAGITNAGLKEAIGNVPVVAALCGQAKSLNEQTAKLGESSGALNTLLDTLIPLFVPVAVPAALPAFGCP
jgi:hypothetical protein